MKKMSNLLQKTEQNSLERKSPCNCIKLDKSSFKIGGSYSHRWKVVI